MMNTLVLEGPFESDYSLAVVNRNLARSFLAIGVPLRLHQRDNVTEYAPSQEFLRENNDLAPLFLTRLPEFAADLHSRYIYPPLTDRWAAPVRAVHCYGWEESHFPQKYVTGFNRDLDVLTTMSEYVRQVLEESGVRVPMAVAGLGADHILSVPAEQPSGVASESFTFLHVSSCFPRKAPEILVRAFTEEFTRRDDVRLVIKTFPNPHNQIDRIIGEATSAHPDHAPILVLREPFRTGQLRWLYEHAGCLLSPSRGEGFGLPVAEAMFLGCPVIATAYSGQSETCSERTCWPVTYRLEPARTHLTEGHSLWAEPQVDSLRRQMGAVLRAATAEREAKIAEARSLVSGKCTWKRVAENHWRACAEVFEAKAGAQRVLPPARDYRIGFVTTWNVRCGIAEYTRYLASALPEYCSPVVFASTGEPVRHDEPYVTRCWEPDGGQEGCDASRLVRAMLESAIDVASVQFNFGFFAPGRIRALVEGLAAAGIPAVITLHATEHPNLERMVDSLRRAAAVVCHRRADADKLRHCGVDTVVLMRQGVPALSFDRDTVRSGARRATGAFVISCFGFFLPAKGIHHLIAAFEMARKAVPSLELKLLNALYPGAQSSSYAASCLALIESRALGPSVSVNTQFLDDCEVLRELACSDLIVLPYAWSSESSSAAVRLPISSGTPVLCSDLAIFDEFSHCVHRYPAGDVVQLANALVRLALHREQRESLKPFQQRAAATLAWPEVAREFAELVTGRGKSRESAGYRA